MWPDRRSSGRGYQAARRVWIDHVVLRQFRHLIPQGSIHGRMRQVDPADGQRPVRLDSPQRLQEAQTQSRHFHIVTGSPQRQPQHVVVGERRVVAARRDVAEHSEEVISVPRQHEVVGAIRLSMLPVHQRTAAGQDVPLVPMPIDERHQRADVLAAATSHLNHGRCPDHCVLTPLEGHSRVLGDLADLTAAGAWCITVSTGRPKWKSRETTCSQRNCRGITRTPQNWPAATARPGIDSVAGASGARSRGRGDTPQRLRRAPGDPPA